MLALERALLKDNAIDTGQKGERAHALSKNGIDNKMFL